MIRIIFLDWLYLDTKRKEKLKFGESNIIKKRNRYKKQIIIEEKPLKSENIH